MKKLTIIIISILTTVNTSLGQFVCGDTLIDIRDGHKYPTVLIGNQCWMMKNLNVGTLVISTKPGYSHSDAANNGIIEKYCWLDDTTNCEIYGGLYDWDEMMQYTTIEGTRGICPDGWHIPTDKEFMTLEEYIGMCSDTVAGCSGDEGYRGTDEGDKLKKDGMNPDICFGSTPPCGTSNLDGIMAGFRNVTGNWQNLGTTTHFWSSTEGGPTWSWDRCLYITYAESGRGTCSRAKFSGYSVRCLCDSFIVDTSDTTTGTIDNLLNEIDIIISPNPTKDKLSIDIYFDNRKNIELQLYNTIGALIYKTQSIGQTKQFEIDLSGRHPGIYYIRITTPKGIIFKKIILTK